LFLALCLDFPFPVLKAPQRISWCAHALRIDNYFSVFNH
jgi:hypothetical protein